MRDTLTFSDQRAAVLRACGYAAADEVSFRTRRNQSPNALTISAGVRGELTADAALYVTRSYPPLNRTHAVLLLPLDARHDVRCRHELHVSAARGQRAQGHARARHRRRVDAPVGAGAEAAGGRAVQRVQIETNIDDALSSLMIFLCCLFCDCHNGRSSRSQSNSNLTD